MPITAQAGQPSLADQFRTEAHLDLAGQVGMDHGTVQYRQVLGSAAPHRGEDGSDSKFLRGVGVPRAGPRRPIPGPLGIPPPAPLRLAPHPKRTTRPP